MANKPKPYPAWHVFNPNKVYVKAVHTDVRRTIEAAKRRLERERQQEQKEPVKWEISRSPSS